MITHLGECHKYILHSINAELYCKLGMKIKKIYRALKFVAKPFIRPWIEHCTQERIKAATAMDTANKGTSF
jgi:hypothetical protein